MMGFLFSSKECNEIAYLLRRELEEILLDLNDHRIDSIVKKAMVERYQLLFRLYGRFVPPKELSKYVLNKKIY